MRDAAYIEELLNDLAFGYALLGDKRRPGAYRNGARIIKKLGTDLPRSLASGELLAMRGIGKGIISIVDAALHERPVEVQQELLQKLPAGLLRARHVRGLGPVRTRVLWQRLGLSSLAEIEYACNENRLLDLPGFTGATQGAFCRRSRSCGTSRGGCGWTRRGKSPTRHLHSWRGEPMWPKRSWSVTCGARVRR